MSCEKFLGNPFNKLLPFPIKCLNSKEGVNLSKNHRITESMLMFFLFLPFAFAHTSHVLGPTTPQVQRWKTFRETRTIPKNSSDQLSWAAAGHGASQGEMKCCLFFHSPCWRPTTASVPDTGYKQGTHSWGIRGSKSSAIPRAWTLPLWKKKHLPLARWRPAADQHCSFQVWFQAEAALWCWDPSSPSEVHWGGSVREFAQLLSIL